MATDAPGFDAWHTDVENSLAVERIFRRALGLPPDVVSNSLLPAAGIAQVAEALRLAPGQLLVDLACGRGGYSREVARRTGARLVGMDFARTAVAIAARGSGQFCVGDFTAVGLRDGSADAVMCIDAIQFAEPPLAAFRECRRILASGGRIVLTAWEPLDPADERVAPRTRRTDLARDLTAAGFEHVEVTEQPGWYAAERTLWEAAVAAGQQDDDPALTSLQNEAGRALATWDYKRRVLGTAIAPGPT